MLMKKGTEISMPLRIIEIDPTLAPFEKDLQMRMENYKNTKKRILKDEDTLSDFANAHLFYGIHRTEDGWV